MLWRAAFYGAGSAGVRSPWRFGHLAFGVAVGGRACELGHVAPSSSTWYGVPWITDFIIDL